MSSDERRDGSIEMTLFKGDESQQEMAAATWLLK